MNNFLKDTDQIYLINLERRSDKRKIFNETILPYLPKIKYFDAIDGRILSKNDIEKSKIRGRSDHTTRGAVGCALSHRKVIEDAYKNNYNRILVLEDDIYIPEPQNLENDINKAADELPDDWEMFYLGGEPTHQGVKNGVDGNNITLYSDNLYKGHYILCTFAYFINKNLIEYMYNDNLSKGVALASDRYYARIHRDRRKTFVPHEKLITSYPNHSDIHEKIISRSGKNKYKHKEAWGPYTPKIEIIEKKLF